MPDLPAYPVNPDTEPPVGSIVASPGCWPLIRTGEGWHRAGYVTAFAWGDVWASDVVLLREGW